MSDEKIVHESQKNSAEKVVIQFRDFKGKKLIDLRIFYLSDDEVWSPTPKGISLGGELLLELKEAIDKAAEEYKKELHCAVDAGDAPDKAVEGRPSRERDSKGRADK